MKRIIFDRQLIFSMVVILAVGLLTLGGISTSLLTSQLLFLAVGLLAFYFFSRFDYLNHGFLIRIYAVGGLLLLLLPFLFGIVTRGAVRWIPLGSLTLQPAELIKPFLIIILAEFMAKHEQEFNQLKTWFKYFLLLVVPFWLIFKQPDLGSGLVILAVGLAILLVSRVKTAYLLGLSLLAVVALPLSWHFLASYQRQRLISFLNPYADPKLSGYQLIQAVTAVGSGGLFGRGLGHGSQTQLKFLPERQTDFIFATIAEELGLVGALILLAAYGLLLWRLIVIGQKTKDAFSFFIVTGTFSLLFFQGIVNIAMNLGLLPVTGITLPLVSSGGSSLLSTMISLGIVHNIALTQKDHQSLEIS